MRRPHRVLQLLGASPGSCRNWVQEHDPIPRAMMAADPYFTMLMQNRWGGGGRRGRGGSRCFIDWRDNGGMQQEL